MAGGFYNHLDDPDEFWDDEPVVPKRSSAAQYVSMPPPQHLAVDERAAQPNFSVETPVPTVSPSRVGSSFVSMGLDRGCLPDRIVVSHQWSTYVAPHEAGDELMAAYRAAVSKRMDELCSAGRWPTPQEISDTATPDIRTIMMVLLETRTWEQYASVSSSMINSGHYRASSEFMIHGQHVVTVTADRTYLQTIEVSIGWVSTAHPDQISDEILRCVEKIRSMRPDFVARRDYSRYADTDLEYQLNQHRLRLLNERMA